MRIDPRKIDEAVELSRQFLTSTTITKKALQSLIGKIMHAVKCTPAARRFTARLLDLLRLCNHSNAVHITREARLDALWLSSFLASFNGKTLLKPLTAQHVAFMDACPTGLGGHSPGAGYYAFQIPPSLQSLQFSISSLECFNLLVGVIAFVHTWSGKRVLVFCDNWAAICAANSGRAEDPLIRTSIRELWWICASNDVELVIRHKPGEEMVDAYTLSRAHLSARYNSRMASLQQQNPDDRIYLQPHNWGPPLAI